MRERIVNQQQRCIFVESISEPHIFEKGEKDKRNYLINSMKSVPTIFWSY